MSSSKLKRSRVVSQLLAILLVAVGHRCVSAIGQDAPRQDDRLSVTFLVNEGFLIEARGKSVLIDSFVKDEYYGYGSLPEATYRQLVRGEPPFAHVSLALASHVHLDHFQVETAVSFLQNNTACVLVSSEEVVLAVRSSKTEPSVANQTTSLWPEPGAVKRIEHDGIRIDAFRLLHTGTRNREVQNLGLLLQWGDVSILHVGDADGRAENFEPFDLAERKIDVAILPIWLFENRPMVNEKIGAKTYIAAHIPASELPAAKRDLSQTQPDVIVLEKPLERWTRE